MCLSNTQGIRTHQSCIFAGMKMVEPAGMKMVEPLLLCMPGRCTAADSEQCIFERGGAEWGEPLTLVVGLTGNGRRQWSQMSITDADHPASLPPYPLLLPHTHTITFCYKHIHRESVQILSVLQTFPSKVGEREKKRPWQGNGSRIQIPSLYHPLPPLPPPLMRSAPRQSAPPPRPGPSRWSPSTPPVSPGAPPAPP